MATKQQSKQDKPEPTQTPAPDPGQIGSGGKETQGTPQNWKDFWEIEDNR
jgi:hypothetical protein